MIDNELFELCKEVYERTDWDDSDLSFYHNTVASTVPPNYEIVENREYHHVEALLYTSDYLLEKLPAKVNGVKLWMSKDPDSDNYFAWYWDGYEHSEYGVHSDTLLKALIKLVIALDDAGVKL